MVKRPMDTVCAVAARCPACGFSGNAPEVASFAYGGWDAVSWCRCPTCRSYFSATTHDLPAQVAHIRTRGYGQVEPGLALNDFKERMFASVLRLVAGIAPPPGRLLDIGCSFGGFLWLARGAGYDVCGADILPEAVAHVRSLGIPAEVAEDAHSVRWAQAQPLDVVTCLDCNYYWNDQTGQLDQIRSLLRQGGLLVLRTTNKAWLFRLALALRWFAPAAADRLLRKAVNDHRFTMSARSLASLLERCGFDVVYNSPRGALYSQSSSLAVKIAFAVGWVAYALGVRCVAPGILILARKQSGDTAEQASESPVKAACRPEPVPWGSAGESAHRQRRGDRRGDPGPSAPSPAPDSDQRAKPPDAGPDLAGTARGGWG